MNCSKIVSTRRSTVLSPLPFSKASLDGQIIRQAVDRQKYRKMDGWTDILTFRQTCRQAGRQAGRQADRQTGRQTDRQAGRLTGRQTDRQADLQTDRKTDQTTWLNLLT
jgi:hypothetical protein